MTRVITWFRQDLRLHDNEALVDALNAGEQVIPVYVFDERLFRGKTIFGFDKISAARAQFILESVIDLRSRLRGLGSDLVVRYGKAEEEIFEIASDNKTSWVFCNRERTRDEVRVQDALERKLWSVGQEVRFSRGKMLFYTADLPFPVTHTPDNFHTFRKETERIISIRETLPEASNFSALPPGLDPGIMPTLSDLIGERSSEDYIQLCEGGESAALSRVCAEMKSKLLQTGDDAHKPVPRFSPWLSQGCLSPKYLYWAMMEAGLRYFDEGEDLVVALCYRDYLRLMVKKHGDAIFKAGGIQGGNVNESQGWEERFEAWASARTGVSIIDAGIRQLNASGFISAHMRTLLASYLVKDIDVPWRVGASYFESRLLDYDPCSNWTNWCNIAGVGPDAREVRTYNYELQAQRVDPDGEYLKRWS